VENCGTSISAGLCADVDLADLDCVFGAASGLDCALLFPFALAFAFPSAFPFAFAFAFAFAMCCNLYCASMLTKGFSCYSFIEGVLKAAAYKLEGLLNKTQIVAKHCS
jgi:hypothetical protein